MSARYGIKIVLVGEVEAATAEDAMVICAEQAKRMASELNLGDYHVDQTRAGAVWEIEP